MTFYTSDLFFGSEKVAAQRGFESVKIMNQTLIDNWNENVKESDYVTILGGFAWDPLSADEALSKLNGYKRFLINDYDLKILEWCKSKINMINVNKNHVSYYLDSTNKLYLSYYPHLEWPFKDKGMFHLHGYSKVKTDLYNKRINVNVELWNYKPIDLEFLNYIITEYTSVRPLELSSKQLEV